MGYQLNADSYITIMGWMVTELNLSGNNLLVYACIYRNSQDGENWYDGSLNQLAQWCNCTVRGVQKNLNNLEEMGLIEKEESFKNNVKFCKYRITDIWSDGGIEQSSILANSETGGIEQSSLSILDNYTTSNTSKLGDREPVDSRKTERRENSKTQTKLIKTSKNDFDWVKDMFNDLCPSMFHVNKMTTDRTKLVKVLLKNYSQATIKECFIKCEKSPFLRKNKSEKWFTFDWILTEKNFKKILNGNYDKDFEAKPKSVEARYNPKMSAKGKYDKSTLHG